MSDDKKLITLKTTDGVEFSVEKSGAMLSNTIRNIIEESGDDNVNVIPIQHVDSITMDKIIKYCNKHKGNNNWSKEELEGFDEELVDGLDQDSFYHLLVAANLLEIKDLINFLEEKSIDVFDE